MNGLAAMTPADDTSAKFDLDVLRACQAMRWPHPSAFICQPVEWMF